MIDAALRGLASIPLVEPAGGDWQEEFEPSPGGVLRDGRQVAWTTKYEGGEEDHAYIAVNLWLYDKEARGKLHAHLMERAARVTGYPGGRRPYGDMSIDLTLAALPDVEVLSRTLDVWEACTTNSEQRPLWEIGNDQTCRGPLGAHPGRTPRLQRPIEDEESRRKRIGDRVSKMKREGDNLIRNAVRGVFPLRDGRAVRGFPADE